MAVAVPDYNDHEAWYERTLTSVTVPDIMEDSLIDRSPSAAVISDVDDVAASGDHAVTESGVRSFDEMPGPRGLPLIGNVLSYSKFGTAFGCHTGRVFTYFYDSVHPSVRRMCTVPKRRKTGLYMVCA